MNLKQNQILCDFMTRGTIVFSKAGRDKGKAMVILESDGEYLTLADGKTRSLQKPKRKKIKHVQPTKTKINLQPVGHDLQDAFIRKQIKEFLEGGSTHCQKTM
jgi:hypothetical protein